MNTIIKPGRYAVIDIGTVTCRLLIADVFDGVLHELERGYGVTNLGEGVDATGYLKPKAMQRVAKQIKCFQTTIELYTSPLCPKVITIAMATSAARDAKNAEDFHTLLAALGIKLTIISGEKEAALSFAGVSNDFKGERLLVVDVGGGSTEVAMGQAKAAPISNHSFDVGCRRLTERYLLGDPPEEEELQQARCWAFESFNSYFNQEAIKSFNVDLMVAVAGTATSVVSMHKRMAVYDSAQVHRSVISRKVLQGIYGQLSRMSLAKLRETIGLDPDRADVIVAGLIILDVLMEICRQDFFTVSESDILQGIILDTATK